MNNKCPYTLAIRQFACQGYIDKRLDNIYTNTQIGTEIPISFGYTITLISGTTRNCTIRISNPLFIPDINFNILNGSFKEFDLPCECATFRVTVGARLGPGVTSCKVS